MANRWLSPTEMRAWRNYVETIGALEAALEADMQPHGITMGDYEVLVRLTEADEQRMRMCDLAADMRLSPSGLTRRLDGLVRGGLVDRHSCPADRRVMYAHVTEAGVAKLKRAAPDHVRSVRDHLLSRLTPDQTMQMGDIFETVRIGLQSRQTA